MNTFRRLGLALTIIGFAWLIQSASAAPDRDSEGRLEAFGAEGKPLGVCPLKHTDVNVDIAGFVARVTVSQQFHNPFQEKIEAIYAFPLSQDSAVDSMTMKVGDRVILGEIKERGEARHVYEVAKAAGHVASLLDQERPNIFTQSVANIEPGEQVDITIEYSETLDWNDGEYHFDFPMVVGPRYFPGTPSGVKGTGWSPPTDQVPDADRISPPVTPEGTRAGHDISVTVNLNAGLPIQRIESKQHEISTVYADQDKTRATITLKKQREIPNKDFVLVYQTATDEIEDTLLTHTDDRGKFFTLVLQPPKRIRPEVIVPKELIFVIDKSGSMRRFPIDTAKEAMRMCVEGLHPNDTFNLMTFAGGVGFCFPQPVPNTDENRRAALDYLASLQGSGGTEMMKAIHACLAGQDDPERVRVVCFMTDGFVGNDMAIIDAVKKNAGVARVFSFGIGTSVNRFLLDGIARAGRGEVHYILNHQETEGAAERFYERIRTPVLTDIELDYGDLAVEEVYPPVVPDLFAVKPVVLKGRYKKGGRGVITLRGKGGAGKFERKIEVHLPEKQPQNEVLAPMWARAKVGDLMTRVPGDDLKSGDTLDDLFRDPTLPNLDATVEQTILALGLEYQLLTQFTSFVAVDQKFLTKEGSPKKVPVPVEMPEGVSHEGVFGSGLQAVQKRNAKLVQSDRAVVKAMDASQRNVIAIKNEVAGLRGRIRTQSLDRSGQFQRVASLTDQVHGARTVRARLEERREQLSTEITRSHEVMQRHDISASDPPTSKPAKIAGVVTATSKSRLVEISVGSDDGVHNGQYFDVHNGKSYLGRVRIRKTAPNRAVGEILPDRGWANIKRGNLVETAPAALLSIPHSPKAAEREPTVVEPKLAPELLGLAEKVAKGTNGNLTLGNIVVKDGRIKVVLELTALTEDSLAQLKALGFQVVSKVETTMTVVGTFDVARLEELAKLDIILYVKPAN